MLTVIGIYIIVSSLVPVYCIKKTFAPIVDKAHLMSVGLKVNYVDIYGINITNIVNFIK